MPTLFNMRGRIKQKANVSIKAPAKGLQVSRVLALKVLDIEAIQVI